MLMWGQNKQTEKGRNWLSSIYLKIPKFYIPILIGTIMMLCLQHTFQAEFIVQLQYQNHI